MQRNMWWKELAAFLPMAAPAWSPSPLLLSRISSAPPSLFSSFLSSSAATTASVMTTALLCASFDFWDGGALLDWVYRSKRGVLVVDLFGIAGRLFQRDLLRSKLIYFPLGKPTTLEALLELNLVLDYYLRLREGNLVIFLGTKEQEERLEMVVASYMLFSGRCSSVKATSCDQRNVLRCTRRSAQNNRILQAFFSMLVLARKKYGSDRYVVSEDMALECLERNGECILSSLLLKNSPYQGRLELRLYSGPKYQTCTSYFPNEETEITSDDDPSDSLDLFHLDCKLENDFRIAFFMGSQEMFGFWAYSEFFGCFTELGVNDFDISKNHEVGDFTVLDRHGRDMSQDLLNMMGIELIFKDLTTSLEDLPPIPDKWRAAIEHGLIEGQKLLIILRDQSSRPPQEAEVEAATIEEEVSDADILRKESKLEEVEIRPNVLNNSAAATEHSKTDGSQSFGGIGTSGGSGGDGNGSGSDGSGGSGENFFSTEESGLGELISTSGLPRKTTTSLMNDIFKSLPKDILTSTTPVSWAFEMKKGDEIMSIKGRVNLRDKPSDLQSESIVNRSPADVELCNELWLEFTSMSKISESELGNTKTPLKRSSNVEVTEELEEEEEENDLRRKTEAGVDSVTISKQEYEELSQSAKKPSLERYIKMLEMGIPRSAVEQKMRIDGIDPTLLPEIAPKLPPPEPQPVQEDGVKIGDADSKYAMYFKMLKMGVPRPAVEIKMRTQGVNPKILDLKLDDLIDLAAKLDEEFAESEKAASAQNETVKPKKSSRKRLHWLEAVTEDSLRDSETNVWKRDDASFIVDDEETQQDVHELFLKTQEPKASSASKTEPKPEKERLLPSILPTNRARNIEIALTKLKLQPEELVNALSGWKINVLTSPIVEIILGTQLLPTQEEVVLLRNQYSLNPLKMAIVDNCLFAVNQSVPDAEKRIRLLNFYYVFDELLEEVQNRCDMLSKACSEARSSAKLKRLLHVILFIGNKIGNAGVEDSEEEHQSSDGKSTILEQFCVFVHRRLPEIEDVYSSELEHVSGARRASFPHLFSELEALERGFQNSKKTLAPYNESSEGVSILFEFIRRADTTLVEARKDLERTKNEFKDLLVYFGEDQIQDAPEFFETLDQFMIGFEGHMKRIKASERSGNKISPSKPSTESSNRASCSTR